MQSDFDTAMGQANDIVNRATGLMQADAFKWSRTGPEDHPEAEAFSGLADGGYHILVITAPGLQACATVSCGTAIVLNTLPEFAALALAKARKQ